MTDAPLKSPPYTDDVQRTLEQWHEVHRRNNQLQIENDRMGADIAVMRHRIDWMENELVTARVMADRYKAANVEITTRLNDIAALFSEGIRRAQEAEHAPQAVLIPEGLKGPMRPDELDDGIKKIAQKFAPRVDGVEST